MCRRRFKTSLGLRMHRRLRHLTTNTSGSSENVYSGAERQDCHRIDGNHVENTTSSLTNLSGDVSQAARKDVFVCSACGRQFRLRHLLVAHMVTHTGERPFPCRAPGCTKQFGQNSTRNFHERTHSDLRLFLCTECGRLFKQSSYLKVHTKMMHGAKQQALVCPVCSKEFRTPMALNLHTWNRHTDECNQMCGQCSRQFKTRQQLRRHHKAIHLNERPWQCSICMRRFSQLNNFKSHLRVHAGERPYLCSVCNRSFTNFSSCRYHLLTHFSDILHSSS